MFLLSIFSFFFSLLIIWNAVTDVFGLDGGILANEQAAGSADDLYDEETLELTKEDELFSLVPSAIINLGWMGFVQYIIHTPLSCLLFSAAPFLFAAEFFFIFQSTDDESSAEHDWIADGLLSIQVYFSLIYLVYCANVAWSMLSGLFWAN